MESTSVERVPVYEVHRRQPTGTPSSAGPREQRQRRSMVQRLHACVLLKLPASAQDRGVSATSQRQGASAKLPGLCATPLFKRSKRSAPCHLAVCTRPVFVGEKCQRICVLSSAIWRMRPYSLVTATSRLKDPNRIDRAFDHSTRIYRYKGCEWSGHVFLSKKPVQA